MKTGYFSFVAHPDLYMCGYHSFDRSAEEAAHIIIDASLKYDVPLEFNANGFRRGLIKTDDGEHYPYPRSEFWKIAKDKKCKVRDARLHLLKKCCCQRKSEPSDKRNIEKKQCCSRWKRYWH